MRWIVTLLAGASLCWTASAAAREFRVQDIPNGDARTCLNCHGELEAKTFNNFGSIARGALDETGPIQEAHVNWSEICEGDSDHDGWTNGYELGDPDCTWVRGDPDPPGAVTNPGSEDSAPPPVCNNGRLDAAEDCEGAEMSFTDCLDVNAGAGDLACSADCTFDYSDCSLPPDGSDSSSDDGTSGGEEGCSVAAASSSGQLVGAALLLGAAGALLRRSRPTRERARRG